MSTVDGSTVYLYYVLVDDVPVDDVPVDDVPVDVVLYPVSTARVTCAITPVLMSVFPFQS